MGKYVFGEEDDELEHVVVRLLSERKQSLAVAEVATGGLVAHRLTTVADFENCFRGALVTAAEQAALAGLDATAGPAPTHDRLAQILAESCRRRFGSDWGLAVGQRSRRHDSESAADAPIVCIALAGRDRVRTAELNIAGDPAIVNSRIAKAALNLLRLELAR
jgi:nicotinamide-nucleotide amidase